MELDKKTVFYIELLHLFSFYIKQYFIYIKFKLTIPLLKPIKIKKNKNLNFKIVENFDKLIGG